MWPNYIFQVEQDKIDEHFNQTAVSKHFEAIMRQIQEYGQSIPQLREFTGLLNSEIDQLKNKIDVIEQQLVGVINDSNGTGNISQNIEQKIRQALESQQGQNNEKFQQHEVKIGTFEGIVSALHREIEKTINALERMEQNRRIMKETMEQNQQKIKILERTIAVKDVSIAELELRVQTLEFASYDGSFIWKVPDFSKKKDDAMQGRSISLYSPPFYTSRRGYKMCARLYPNGDGMGKGTHLSLFFVVMRGNYDQLLPWPFKQRVTFCLVNQNGKEHVLDSFRPDPTSTSFRRPTSDMNIASGCPLFLRLETLQTLNHGFLKEDTLFVKVMVDLNDPPLSEPLRSVDDRITVPEIVAN